MLLHHLCIQTPCYRESLDFYTRALGMRVIEETAGFHGRAYNTWLEGMGFMIELQTPKAGENLQPIDRNHAGVSHLCLLVKDLDAVYAMLVKNGVTTFYLRDGKPLYEVLGGRLFKLRAPEGTVIEFRDKPGC